jgi:hypothetical protein
MSAGNLKPAGLQVDQKKIWHGSKTAPRLVIRAKATKTKKNIFTRS